MRHFLEIWYLVLLKKKQNANKKKVWYKKIWNFDSVQWKHLGKYTPSRLRMVSVIILKMLNKLCVYHSIMYIVKTKRSEKQNSWYEKFNNFHS
jgi:hypothetical protein